MQIDDGILAEILKSLKELHEKVDLIESRERRKENIELKKDDEKSASVVINSKRPHEVLGENYLVRQMTKRQLEDIQYVSNHGPIINSPSGEGRRNNATPVKEWNKPK